MGRRDGYVNMSGVSLIPDWDEEAERRWTCDKKYNDPITRWWVRDELLRGVYRSLLLCAAISLSLLFWWREGLWLARWLGAFLTCLGVWKVLVWATRPYLDVYRGLKSECHAGRSFWYPLKRARRR